jgi:prepilin-type N-terminal cleavage/methylation domain-containing protein
LAGTDPEEYVMLRRRGKAGVTLIEMLTVILIIGLIAALIMPAVQKARRRSREVKALAEVTQLKNAWRSYVSTYMNDRRVTSLPSVSEMSPDAVKILLGTDASANPDQIKFMDFPVNAATEGFLDPWGQTYRVTIEDLQKTAKTWTYSTRVYCANRNPAE